MGIRERSRRSFLVASATGLSAGWLTTNWLSIVEAQPRQFRFFTQAQAVEIEAVTAQIIPTDATPGAREARCVDFIDRLLATREKGRQAAYTQGLSDLQAKAAELVPGTVRFSALSAAQQTQVLTAIEKTPFFTMIRNDTVIGMFADPKHGGNHDRIGWKLIGYHPSLEFPYANKAPFGHYDALIA